MSLLLGIDAGSTVTKAVVFDLQGKVLVTAQRRVALNYPRARHVERDQDELWQAVCGVSSEAMAGLDPADVMGVGVTSHGDGVYLVDDELRPTRPGIMSLDTRADELVRQWRESGRSEEIFQITGQFPWASAPGVLLAWLAQNEPETVARSAWALAAKDMLKSRMTGEVSTELTEASLSFTNVFTQQYDSEIFPLIGVADGQRLLAPVISSDAVAGVLTASAAAQMGLRAGTPVAAGAHDVDCSAIGSGVVGPGVASVVAGSFSINQVISDEPTPGRQWYARNFIEPGRWMNMSISPTSSANMEWFIQQFCAADVAAAEPGIDPLAFIDREVHTVMGDPSDVVFTPFLFGSLSGAEQSATFTGLQAWHTRGHVLRAIMEGVALGHQSHVAALRSAFEFDRVRLTGGATKSPIWCQIFADAFGLPVEIPSHEESGSWGAAMLAGIAVGVFADAASGVGASVGVAREYEPSTAGVARLRSSAWSAVAFDTRL